MIPDGSVSPLTARPASALEPMTQVLIVVLPRSRTGIILGALPDYVPQPDSFVHPEITAGSGTSQATDRFFTSHLSPDNPGMINYSCGAPPDGTIDSKGWISPLGPGVYSDSNTAFVRVSKFTGVWAFTVDDTVRIAGKTLQVWTDGFAIEGWNDQDATSTVTGISLFGWEALGHFTPNVSPPNRLSGAQVQIDSPELSMVEPALAKQTPFRRIVTYAGYLGYGSLQIVQLPPANSDGPLTVGGADRPLMAGIDQVGIDGSRTITSARAILIAHTPLLHAPTPQAYPFDPTGYVRPQGVIGEGQKLDGEPVDISDGPSCGLTATDQVAYAQMWRAGSSFFYDSPDWTPPQPRGESVNQPSFTDLTEEQFLPIVSEMVRVDHRHSIPYFSSTSFFYLAPDGRVVIAGPSGEEIRMGGGTIEVIAPGDINSRAGRNVLSMAGRTHATIANDSLEISASKGTVKLKAEKDMQLLAGNSGIGAMIIESRSKVDFFNYTEAGDATQGGGVILKSANQLAFVGGNVYLRSTDGPLVLDAAQGEQDILMVGNAVRSWLADGLYEYFGTQGDTTAAGYRSADTMIAPGDIRVAGNLIAKQSVFAGSNIYAADGTFASGQASQTDGKVQSLQDESLSQVRDTVDAVDTTETTLTQGAQTVYESELVNAYYQSEKVGDLATIGSVGFRFRTAEQYRTAGYKLFEARWAQQSRKQSQTLLTWVEPPVAGPAGDTYPFPGDAVWNGDSYATLDPKLYNPQTGEPYPPGTPYENVSELVPEMAILNNSIPII